MTNGRKIENLAKEELLATDELTAKLTGELDERAQHNELHVHLTADRALAVAKTYMERHGAGGETPTSLSVAEAGQVINPVEQIQPLDGNAAAVAAIREEAPSDEHPTG